MHYYFLGCQSNKVRKRAVQSKSQTKILAWNVFHLRSAFCEQKHTIHINYFCTHKTVFLQIQIHACWVDDASASTKMEMQNKPESLLRTGCYQMGRRVAVCLGVFLTSFSFSIEISCKNELKLLGWIPQCLLVQLQLPVNLWAWSWVSWGTTSFRAHECHDLTPPSTTVYSSTTLLVSTFFYLH